MAKLKVRVSTRSSRSGLAAESGVIKAFLHSPPSEGRANDELIELVAKTLGMPKSSMTIVRGAKSRDKEIVIDRLDQETLDGLIADRLGAGRS